MNSSDITDQQNRDLNQNRSNEQQDEKTVTPETELELLLEIIYAYCKQHGQGLGFKEIDIMRFLQKAPNAFFSPHALQDPLMLFQAHFMVFHCLYKLRSRFIEQNLWLEIHALAIKLEPYQTIETDSTAVVREDKLSRYYLDWDNFQQTGREQVEALLNDFWQRMSQPQLSSDNASLISALQTLQLSSELLEDLEFHWQKIKQSYRQLAMRYHPDRINETTDTEQQEEKFKQINHAYYLLKTAKNC